MAALVLLLLWLLLGVHSTSSATVTTVAPAAIRLPFTVDGRRAHPGPAALVLRRGDVVRFDAAVTSMRIRRLECRGDVHRLGRVWHVPDLPEGEYALSALGPRSFSVLVRASGHSAPCPVP